MICGICNKTIKLISSITQGLRMFSLLGGSLMVDNFANKNKNRIQKHLILDCKSEFNNLNNKDIEKIENKLKKLNVKKISQINENALFKNQKKINNFIENKKCNKCENECVKYFFSIPKYRTTKHTFKNSLKVIKPGFLFLCNNCFLKF